MTVEGAHGATRITLPVGSSDGATLTLSVPCGRDFARGARVAARANALLIGRREPAGYAWRPRLGEVLLMRALIALDGHLQGGSYREIAEALYGRRHVEQRWRRDPTLKDQVRYLVRRGLRLMNRASPRV